MSTAEWGSESLYFRADELNLEALRRVCPRLSDPKEPVRLRGERGGGSFGSVAGIDSPAWSGCLVKFSNYRELETYYHNEYRILAKIDGLGGYSPRAVAYGAVTAGGLTFPAYVMEEVSGRCIGEYLMNRPGRGFAPSAVAGLGLDLLKAISLLRGYGVCHSDLSLGNVVAKMAVRNGVQTFSNVKIIDYGQSKDPEIYVTPPTISHRMPTLFFAAPESIPLGYVDFHDDRRLRNRLLGISGYYGEWTVDVWSLGAIMFRMAAGRDVGMADDHASSPSDLYYDIIASKQKSLSLAPYLAFRDGDRIAHLSRAIELCTAWNPDDRRKAVDGGQIKRELKLAIYGDFSREEKPRLDDDALTPTPEVSLKTGGSGSQERLSSAWKPASAKAAPPATASKEGSRFFPQRILRFALFEIVPDTTIILLVLYIVRCLCELLGQTDIAGLLSWL